MIIPVNEIECGIGSSSFNGSKEKDKAMVDSNRLVSFFVAFLTFSYFSKTLFFLLAAHVSPLIVIYILSAHICSLLSPKKGK